MTDFAKLNNSLHKALSAIGTTNGHAPPTSQDPLDQYLHEYYVAKIAGKYFDDRASAAKDALLNNLGADASKTVSDMIAATIQNGKGESAIVAQGQHYALDFNTRKGASRLDKAKLKTVLQIKHGMPALVVDQIIAECSKDDMPTKMFTVKPMRD